MFGMIFHERAAEFERVFARRFGAYVDEAVRAHAVLLAVNNGRIEANAEHCGTAIIPICAAPETHLSALQLFIQPPVLFGLMA